MVHSVEETEVLQNENTNKEPGSGKAKASSTPGNPVAQAGGLSAFGGRFSTFFGGVPSFVPPVAAVTSGVLDARTIQWIGRFWGLFGSVWHCCIFVWIVSLMFTRLPTSIFCTPIKKQCTSFLFNTFWRSPKRLWPFSGGLPPKLHNKLRIFKNSTEAGQAITWTRHATFLCDSRTLTRRAYRDHPHLLEQIVVTRFIEGLNNSTLRWELGKLKPENADHALAKAFELQAYLELEGRSPIGTASSSVAGVNHMTKHLVTENTAIFHEFVRSLKRDTDNMPHNQNRGSRDNSRNRERDRNISTDRRSQNDSRDDTRNPYGTNTQDTRNTYMPSRNRQDNRDDSRQRYGQRYDSRERRPKQQNRSVRFESPRRDRGQNRQNINFNSWHVQNRPQSPYQNRQYEFNSNPGRRSNNYTTITKPGVYALQEN